MKFISVWEFKHEDTAKVIERWTERLKLEGNPDFPKAIYGPFTFYTPLLPRDTVQGFTMYESDSVEKFQALSSFYSPLLKMQFIPVLENTIGAPIFAKWARK